MAKTKSKVWLKTETSEKYIKIPLTLSWWEPLSYRNQSYRNQSIDLQSKSMDWFLYDNGLRHEKS